MTNNNNQTSLFIPHIFANIDEERIKSVIETAKYGQVEQIDLIPKKSGDGKAYNSAYIHMKSWNEDEKTQKFLAHLKDTSKQTHLVYDKPWYWIVLENTSSDKKKTKTLDMKEFPNLKPQATVQKPQATVQKPQATTDAVWANLREPPLTPPLTPPRLNKTREAPGAPTNKTREAPGAPTNKTREAPGAPTNKTREAPGAPTKKRKALRNLNLEQEFADQELPTDDENMNLVDAEYVYHMEQDNMQLRNNNDWIQQQNYMLQQEVERLRSMMLGMVGMGMM
jgi:hypothetical protein